MTKTLLTRRGLIVGSIALLSAPAIVRVSSLMPINAALAPELLFGFGLAQLKTEGMCISYDPDILAVAAQRCRQ